MKLRRNIETREYGHGTSLTQSFPWGLYVGGKALCSDGKVRTLKRISETADTFFSVPAAVTVKGRTVAGYVTVESIDGFTSTGEPVVKFVAVKYRRNHYLLPEGTYRERD